MALISRYSTAAAIASINVSCDNDEAGLSFLGLGDPEIVIIGYLISNSNQFLFSGWWIFTFWLTFDNDCSGIDVGHVSRK